MPYEDKASKVSSLNTIFQNPAQFSIKSQKGHLFHNIQFKRTLTHWRYTESLIRNYGQNHEKKEHISLKQGRWKDIL